MTRIALNGAAGRMGRMITALATESDAFQIVSAMDEPACGHLKEDLGELAGVGALGVIVDDRLDGEFDVIVDFSLPEGTLSAILLAEEAKIPMVIGTTGFAPRQEQKIAKVAESAAIVKAGNMSLGINVLLSVVAQVARTLGDDYDIEITETHHRFKKDAPSGTAKMLGRSVCEALGKEFDETAQFGRSGQSLRRKGQIGMHAIRLGDTVGEHAVQFGSMGETVTIAHSAHTRETFGRGALRAAEWVTGQQPGLYDMQDVLGLK